MFWRWQAAATAAPKNTTHTRRNASAVVSAEKEGVGGRVGVSPTPMFKENSNVFDHLEVDFIISYRDNTQGRATGDALANETTILRRPDP